MSDRFDEFIRKNRSELDGETAEAGHLDRFREKLMPKSRRKVAWGAGPLLMAAALICAVLLIPGVEAPTPAAESPTSAQLLEGLPEGASPVDMAEVEFYYSLALSSNVNRMEAYRKIQDALVKTAMQRLLELEGEYENLKLEFLISYADDRIVGAMIRNYQLRIQVLRVLTDQMEMNRKLRDEMQNEITDEV